MAYREFADANGVHWKVWDTVPSSGANVRARYARGWLTFESEIERRRISPIPDGWQGGEEAVLCDWLQNASVIQPAQWTDLPDRRGTPRPETGDAAPAPSPGLPAGIRRVQEVIRSIGRTLGR